MTNSSSLTLGTTALHVDADVELASASRGDQRFVYDHAQGLGGKIGFKRTAVHRDFSGANCNANAGDGSLAAASAKKFRNFCHINQIEILRCKLLDVLFDVRERGGLLRRVGMLVTRVNFKLGQQDAAKTILGNHALDGVGD